MLAATASPAVISPAADALSDQVKRGEYLARAGDCFSCPTTPGGQPLAGGLRMDTPFGSLVSFEHSKMPLTAPGSLTLPNYQNLAAFILQQNGLPAGKRPLSSGADNARVLGLKLEIRHSPHDPTRCQRARPTAIGACFLPR